MKYPQILDLYTDYLLASKGPATATGLSNVTGGRVSHDTVTRMLSLNDFESKDLWAFAKPLVRKHGLPDGVIAVDDTIIEKAHSDENSLVCWHHDHAKGRSVKGIGLLTAFYHCEGVSIPVGYSLVNKDIEYTDAKTGAPGRRAAVSKNDMLCGLLRAACANRVPFRHVLADSWYGSAANMLCIKQELGKDFVIALKTNRTAALTAAEARRGNYLKITELGLEPGMVRTVWVDKVPFPLHIVKDVYVNEDGSTAESYLATSDLGLSFQETVTLYGQRWGVEVYHKSLKQNEGVGASPAKGPKTQANHVFASLCAYLKAEKLRILLKQNHFSLKSAILTAGLMASIAHLTTLTAQALSAGA